MPPLVEPRCSTTREAMAMTTRGLQPHRESSPCSPQLRNAHAAAKTWHSQKYATFLKSEASTEIKNIICQEKVLQISKRFRKEGCDSGQI